MLRGGYDLQEILVGLGRRGDARRADFLEHDGAGGGDPGTRVAAEAERFAALLDGTEALREGLLGRHQLGPEGAHVERRGAAERAGRDQGTGGRRLRTGRRRGGKIPGQDEIEKEGDAGDAGEPARRLEGGRKDGVAGRGGS